MSLHMAVDYWRDRARIASDRQIQLDAELTQARCRAGRGSAENAAIALAAHALLAALENSERLRPLVADLQEALNGAYTQGMRCAIGDSVGIYEAAEVIRRMLEKMKTGDKMKRAAVKWATEQMLRKRIDLAKIQKWTIGGS
jgi:hypothetical protein